MWDRTPIRRLVEHYPRLLENVLWTASDYVTWHLMSHIGIASYTARQRLAEVLITLARTVGQKTTDGVTLDITNQELADAANITVFTASRLISEWRRTRALVKHRGKILLQSPDWLLSRPYISTLRFHPPAPPRFHSVIALEQVQGWIAQEQRPNQPHMACFYGNN